MIVLDTHIWLWWINRDQNRIKPAWTARLDRPERVGVSAISCFEVAWLTRHGRIELPGPEKEDAGLNARIEPRNIHHELARPNQRRPCHPPWQSLHHRHSNYGFRHS